MLLKEAKEILERYGYIVEASRWSPYYRKRETEKPEWYGKEECKICGEPATHRIRKAWGKGQYDSYDYFCDKCADEMTLG